MLPCVSLFMLCFSISKYIYNSLNLKPLDVATINTLRYSIPNERVFAIFRTCTSIIRNNQGLWDQFKGK